MPPYDGIIWDRALICGGADSNYTIQKTCRSALCCVARWPCLRPYISTNVNVVGNENLLQAGWRSLSYFILVGGYLKRIPIVYTNSIFDVFQLGNAIGRLLLDSHCYLCYSSGWLPDTDTLILNLWCCLLYSSGWLPKTDTPIALPVVFQLVAT